MALHTEGIGSLNSPIIISDEEEDALAVARQLQPESEFTPPFEPDPTAHLRDTKAYRIMLWMGYVPGNGLGRELDGEIEPLPWAIVWRRTECGVGFREGILSRPASPMVTHGSPDMRPPKRKRDLSPFTLDDGRPAWWTNDMHADAPGGSDLPSSANGLSGRPAPTSMMSRKKRLKLEREMELAERREASKPPRLIDIARTLPCSAYCRDPTCRKIHPSSGSGPSTGDIQFNDALPSKRGPPYRPRLPTQQSSIPDVPHTQPALVDTRDDTKPIASSSRLPPQKKSSLPIGMRHSSAADSKHGLFPNGSSVSTPTGEPHIPNPSRTLVMEPLPKKFRNPHWVKEWCHTAAGAHPAAVHVDVDPKAGKALIEFTQEDLAEAAFNSPRFQDREGKGGIRVWWYRTAAEVEDGEICEGQAPPDNAPPKKPKKKKEKKKSEPPQHQPASVVPMAGTNVDLGLLPHLHATMGFPPPNVPMLQNFAGQASFPTFAQFVQNPAQYMAPYGLPYSGLPVYNPGYQPTTPSFPLASPMDVSPEEQDYLIDDDKLSYPPEALDDPMVGQGPSTAPDDDHDHDSIASSRGGSPLPLHTATPGPVDAEDSAEDMDVESPVSHRVAQRSGQGSIDFSRSDIPPLQDGAPVPIHAASSAEVTLHEPAPHHAHTSTLNPYAIPFPSPDVPATTSLPTPSLPAPISPPRLPPTVTPLRQSPEAHLQDPILPTASTMTLPVGPRAMKKASVEPKDIVKRSLLERQKELEERISRSKMELGVAVESAHSPTVKTSHTVPSVAAASPTASEPRVDKVAMEEALRKLVLQSKNSKALAPGVAHRTLPSIKVETGPQSLPPTSPPATLSKTSIKAGHPGKASRISPASSSESDPTISSASSKTTLPAAIQSPFDDLAVSFITETLHTITKPAASSQRNELAARQKRLEQHIAESKELMLKLNAARTKQEKDIILRIMRERSRAMEDDMKAPPPPAPTVKNEVPSRPSSQNKDNGSLKPHGITQIHWPETRHDAGVFEISDDEDDGVN